MVIGTNNPKLLHLLVHETFTLCSCRTRTQFCSCRTQRSLCTAPAMATALRSLWRYAVPVVYTATALTSTAECAPGRDPTLTEAVRLMHVRNISAKDALILAKCTSSVRYTQRLAQASRTHASMTECARSVLATDQRRLPRRVIGSSLDPDPSNDAIFDTVPKRRRTMTAPDELPVRAPDTLPQPTLHHAEIEVAVPRRTARRSRGELTDPRTGKSLIKLTRHQTHQLRVASFEKKQAFDAAYRTALDR